MRYIEDVHLDLPPILRDAVSDLVNQLQAPAPMITSAVLAAASLACQDKIDVKRGDGDAGPVSLNLIVIAESGERKSAVFREVFKPIFAVDEKHRSRYERERQEYERELAVWTTVKKAIEKKIINNKKIFSSADQLTEQLSKHLECEPTAPQLKALVVQNTTIDALMQFLHYRGGSAGLLSDEGGLFFKSRLTSNLAPLNSIWSGDPIVVDRLDSSRSMALSKDSRLTSLIMVQPKTLDDFLRSKGELSRDNGYLARFLICHPLSRQGSRHVGGGSFMPSSYGKDNFHRRLIEVLESNEKKVLRLSVEAEAVWFEFYNKIETDLSPIGYLSGCKDAGSKAPEIALRLAAIFHHMSQSESNLISVWDMQLARTVISRYLEEFVRLFAPTPPVDSKAADANELHAWLLKEQAKRADYQAVEKRKILSHGPAKFRSRSRRDEALDTLRSWGWLVERKDKNRLFVQALVIQPINPMATYTSLGYQSRPVSCL